MYIDKQPNLLDKIEIIPFLGMEYEEFSKLLIEWGWKKKRVVSFGEKWVRGEPRYQSIDQWYDEEITLEVKLGKVTQIFRN